jgi:hypothetical protein
LKISSGAAARSASKFGMPRRPRSITPGGTTGSTATWRNSTSSAAATGVTFMASSVSSSAQSSVATRNAAAPGAARAGLAASSVAAPVIRLRRVRRLTARTPWDGR